MSQNTPIHAIEFFAGIGLAKLGLERAGVRVIWSNDMDPAKESIFRQYPGHSKEHEYVLSDVRLVKPGALPTDVHVAWASSPCTDLSVAGGRSGIHGSSSSAFWPWIELIDSMGDSAPRVAVLENVTGLISSNGGDDLRAVIEGFNATGYSVDILAIDAVRFLPQSRPRLFLVGVKMDAVRDSESAALYSPSALRPESLRPFFENPALVTHIAKLPDAPAARIEGLLASLDNVADDSSLWWDARRLGMALDSMSSGQRTRLDELAASGGSYARAAYRRTRNGKPTWEARPDDVAGCLRTAKGGSSKQAVVVIRGGEIKMRWMTPNEYAVLMGVNDFPMEGPGGKYLFAFGDAVAVPVVEWLAREYVVPFVARGANA